MHMPMYRGVKAYIYTMHGKGIQLAPLTDKEADSICAELIKQVPPHILQHTLSAPHFE